MILDSKGKLFGKISIIDILVVLLILGVAGGAFYKFSKSGTPGVFTQLDKIEAVLYIEDTPEFVVQAMQKGDIAREVVQNAVFGIITDIKAGPSVVFGVNDQGVWVKSTRPGYISLEVTVQGEGLYGNNGVSFANALFYVGKSYEMKIGNGYVYGRIKSLKKVQ